jgi:coproporphyrinogen III oxidase
MNHLEDTNYSKYSLQLNLYKYILEKNYNMKIGGMFLIILHPKNDNYIVEYVNDMGKDIHDIINYRASKKVVNLSGNTI